jgi:predicted metal-binding membrane protein
MAILLATGSMELVPMAAVTVAIAVERLALAGAPIAHAIGAVAIAAGLLLLAQAAGLEPTMFTPEWLVVE